MCQLPPSLPHSSTRGQILVEAREPHFVTSVDGAAARMLQSTSTRVCGRRAKGIAKSPEEQTRLGEALLCAQATSHCVCMSITSPAGRRVPAMVQRQCAGDLIEISLFPAESSHALLSSLPSSGGVVVGRREDPLSFDELKVQVDLDDLRDETKALENTMLAVLGGAREDGRKHSKVEAVDTHTTPGDSSAALC